MLVLMLVALLCIAVPEYRRNAAIREIEAAGGGVVNGPVTPQWLRGWIGYDSSIKSLFADTESIDLESAADPGRSIGNLELFPRLKSLLLSFSGVTDSDLAQVSKSKSLEYVGLNDTPITDAGLAHLAGLTNLEFLDLGQTRVTDAGLVHLHGLSDLRTLCLHHTEVTDGGIDELKKLRKLQQLLLYGTHVTDAGATELKRALPGCEIVR